jgi:general stress protein 26
MNKRTFLYKYIHQRMIGVLSTVNTKGKPEAAVMEFGDTKDLELIFDTRSIARKYRNLKKNPRVAFVIGWEEGTTVQYEGIATELHGKELAEYKKIMFDKNDEFKRWEKIPGVTYFKITPTWIRYSAMNNEPWEITFP